jgi:hypothetical protein
VDVGERAGDIHENAVVPDRNNVIRNPDPNLRTRQTLSERRLRRDLSAVFEIQDDPGNTDDARELLGI